MIFLKGAVYVIILLLNVSICYSQVDWQTIPWINVGIDSSAYHRENIILTGNIKIKGSNEPIIGASISVDSYKYFDYSDAHGRYVLEMPAGNYRITVRHVGMKPGFYRLNVLSGGLFNVELEEGTFNLEEVIVTSRPIDSNIKQSISGLTSMGIGEIKTLPSLLGEVDIIKGLQLMPGVTTVGEAASGFNVRGGRPDQNLVLLNNSPIFNTSHALGFVSSFNQDIVHDFSLYKGTVPAQLGGRASSVLDINTRRGDFEKWTFQGGVGPISSRFTAEGPVKEGKTSVLLSGRLAYPNWMLNKVENPDVNKSAATFNDLYTSFNHRINSNNTLEFNLYSSKDYFRFSDQFAYRWSNFLSQVAWRGFADRKASPLVTLAYGEFKTELINPTGPSASQLSNAIKYIQFKPTVNYQHNEKLAITAGIESMIYLPKDEELTGYNNPNFATKTVNKDNGLESSLFINGEYELTERIGLSVGLRSSYYMLMGSDTIFQYTSDQPRIPSAIYDTTVYNSFEKIHSYAGLEPRVALRMSTFKNQSIKVSYNRMKQYIHQISNTASVTPVDVWQVSTAYIPPQLADNFSAGYFWNLDDNVWETSVETFYKNIQNLVEYKNFPDLYVNRHLETELLVAQGKSYGVELYVRKIKGMFTGWLSYTYSQTLVRAISQFPGESINNGDWYPSNYNKPHLVNLVLNKRTYRNGAFSLIASFASGRPMTAVESSYIVDGAVVPIYTDRNKYKIPNYFRIDVSFTVPSVFRKISDSLVLSLYNLLGRDNAYSVYYQRPADNYFIPKPYKLSILGSTLPSITYNFKF